MHSFILGNRSKVLALAECHGLRNVRVFGSMALGDATDDSDVDLLVTLPPGISALALGGLLMDAQDFLERQMDVVSERGLHPSLCKRVLHETVPL